MGNAIKKSPLLSRRVFTGKRSPAPCKRDRPRKGKGSSKV